MWNIPRRKDCWGELRISQRVESLIACSSSSAVILKPSASVVSTTTGVPEFMMAISVYDTQ
jgi:hypothetical protein